MHHQESTSILYAEHRQGLFSMTLSILQDVGLAEDAVHDGVHRVLARSAPPAGDPVAYLYASVRNAALDLLRRARVRAAEPVSDLLCDGRAPDPAHRASDREAVRRMRSALDELSPEQREVIILRSVARLGFEQIAAVVSAPVGTVAARYSRGITTLRRALEEVSL